MALPCYQTSVRLLLSIKQTCLHTHPITTDQRHVARVVLTTKNHSILDIGTHTGKEIAQILTDVHKHIHNHFHTDKKKKIIIQEPSASFNMATVIEEGSKDLQQLSLLERIL